MAEPEGDPVWTELRNDPASGAYWQDWYCEVPPESAAYTVIREDWSGHRLGYPVRRIFEIRLGAPDVRRA